MGFLSDVLDPSGWFHDVDNDFLAQVGDPLGISPGNPGVGMKSPGDQTNESADALAEIARGLFEQSAPLRGELFGRSEDFLSGGMDVTKSPMFGSLKTAVDSQFGRARENVIAGTARGGGLTDALTNLETDRAVTMSQGIGGLAGDEMNRAFGLATGLLPASTSGLGQAAGIQAQQLAAQQANQAQAKQGAGAGAGMLLGSFLA